MSGPGDWDELLDELAAVRLRPDRWAEVETQLRRVAPGDEAALSQVVFEARIQRRFQAGRATSTLPPTKQTSALPWVGLVCGGLLLAVGWALGGGIVLVGVGALGLLVFVVAMAGSRVTHARVGPAGAPGEPATGPPASVSARLDELRRPRS